MKETEDTMRDWKVSKVKVKKIRDTQVQKVVNSRDFRYSLGFSLIYRGDPSENFVNL